jgi:hypothetical protein
MLRHTLSREKGKVTITATSWQSNHQRRSPRDNPGDALGSRDLMLASFTSKRATFNYLTNYYTKYNFRSNFNIKIKNY